MGTAVVARGRARIRGFTVAVTIVGLIVVALLTWLSVSMAEPFGSADSASRVTTSDDYYRPWDDPNPTAASHDDDVWSGRGQQVISLTGLTPGEPVQFTLIDEHDVRRIFAAPTPDVSYASDTIELEILEDRAYFVPATTEATVWVSVAEPTSWRMRIAGADLENRSGVVAGVGSDAFVYTGDATAARITTSVDDSLWVHVITDSGVDQPLVGRDTRTQTIAWADSAAVVFLVETGDVWSFEFFESAPPTPTPTPTGGPDE